MTDEDSETLDALLGFPLREVRERILREYEAGTSKAAICRGLNADGILTPRGGQWRHRNLEPVLRHAGLLPMYEGSAALSSPQPMERVG